MFYNYVMELCFITVFYNIFIGAAKAVFSEPGGGQVKIVGISKLLKNRVLFVSFF